MSTQESGLKDAPEKNDLWGMLNMAKEHTLDNAPEPLG